LVADARTNTREIWSSAQFAYLEGRRCTRGATYRFLGEDNGRTLLYMMDNDGSHVTVLADSLALRGNPALGT